MPLMSDFFVPEDDVPPPDVTVQPIPSVGAAQTSR
jgi:citronellol/citronellal dehydrogenase